MDWSGSEGANTPGPGSEDDAAEGGMPEKGHGGLAMPVEGRRLLEQGHDAIDARQFDEFVDRLVAQSRDDAAKGETDADLLSQPLAPPRFVMPERARIEPIARESLIEHVGGNGAAEQPVIDAAAGRRLDQTRRIADGQHAIGVR